MLTSCILPSLTKMKDGILPRKSSNVCSLTAALVERNGAHAKHRQAQIDGRGIQRVDGVLEINSERLVGIEAASDADQALRKVAVDAPVARRIRIGERVACNRTAKAEVIEPCALRPQTRLDVAQALAISQLRKRHRQVLIEAGEPFDLVLARVAPHAAMESRERQVLHHLREHVLALVHRLPPPPFASRQDCLQRESRRGPNRHQIEMPLPPCASSSYRAGSIERWDTTDGPTELTTLLVMIRKLVALVLVSLTSCGDDNRVRALIEAAGRGDIDRMSVLIDSGANVNGVALDGWTPLTQA